VNIWELLIEDILQVSSRLVTGNFADDFIFIIFLPSIFLIAFIYFVSHVVLKGHRGISILLGIGMYVYIIFAGWYSVMVSIARFYFPFIIIFGVIAFLFGHFRFGGKGGGGQQRGGFSSLVSAFRGTPREREIKDTLKQINAALSSLKNDLNKATDPMEKLAISQRISRLKSQKEQYEAALD
jgi:hypothetical protein